MKKKIIAIALMCIIGPYFAYSAFSEGEDGWIVAKPSEVSGYDLSAYTPDQDVNYSFDGNTFTLDIPSMRRADDIWAPARLLLQKMQVMFLSIDDERCSVMQEDGKPLMLKVGYKDVLFKGVRFMTLEEPPAKYQGEFYLSINTVAALLDFSFSFDSQTNTVTFSRTRFEELSTFTLPKPKIAPEDIKAPVTTLKAGEPQDIREEVPTSAIAPDIRLNFNQKLTYLLDETNADRTRMAEWYITGRAFDYTVDGHFRLRDLRTAEKQRIKQDAEFLGFYAENLWLRFFDLNFPIPKLRSQSQKFFGGEIYDFYGPLTSYFGYGRTDNTVSGPAAVGAVRYYGQLYAFREEYKLPEDLGTTAGTFVFHEAEAESQGKSGTTDHPRQTLLFITDSTINLYDDLTFDYAHAFSSYQPDDKVNKHLWDDDWRLALDLNEDRYAMKAAYEHVGEQYVSVGIPSTYQDYEGWDFSTRYQFAKNWSANAGARLAKDNVEQNPRLRTNFDKSVTASTTLGLPWQNSISTGATVSESISKGGDLDMDATRNNDFRMDYTNTWGNMSTQLSFDHYTLHPFAASLSNGSTSDLYSCSIYNYYPELNGSYVRLYESYRRTKSLAANSYTTEAFDTNIGGRLNLLRNLSFTSSVRVSTTVRENFTDTAMATLQAGGQFFSAPSTSFSVDFNLSNYDLYNQKTWLGKDYTVLFQLNHTFTVATPEKWGKVRAFVYEDKNSNGAYDKGEPPVTNVRAYIVNGRAAFTDKYGYAVIEKVTPGNREIKLDPTKMPINSSVRGEAVQPVLIKPRDVTDVEFALYKPASVKGRVFVDKDGDGVYTKRADKPLPNVYIYLIPEGKETLTMSDGSFIMDYVYPGEYSVAVNLDSVPSEYTISSPEKIQVSLGEGAKVEDLVFTFAPRPVKVEVLE